MQAGEAQAGREAGANGTFHLPVRCCIMPFPFALRKKAKECRLLAARADKRTADSLLKLASDFEVEADRIARSWKPGGDA